MELAESYLWKINGIAHVHDGVYHAKSESYEDAQALAGFWHSRYKGEKVLIAAGPDTELEYMDRFDFSVVMRLLPSGYKVIRLSWMDGIYLEMRKDGIYAVSDGCGECHLWQPQMKDLMAGDWRVMRREKVPEWDGNTITMSGRLSI
ncbi:hypothetical protein GZH47_32885 (plasmid) [Paenibacillus rhizovicinus]|uniref:Thoeris anti-defense 2-like domain-containing protein n=1 Tax=Paenibacillus rhizovicinus TaxID=2704463 RepID=A0A6C0PAT1_9BACL|nr:hypothetical protein [Paenibacillus rhizovicinus]QHW35690.1 hypothetical protein GZH47_32885 [Paenibacillus rhizovicinus]